jgi:pimeloyl-ACP methyl ester carboxylesterase
VSDLLAAPEFTYDDLRSIRCPTLLVYGEFSDIFNRATVLAELMPNAELHVIKAHHFTVLMGETKPVRRVILEWLDAARHADGGAMPSVG